MPKGGGGGGVHTPCFACFLAGRLLPARSPKGERCAAHAGVLRVYDFGAFGLAVYLSLHDARVGIVVQHSGQFSFGGGGVRAARRNALRQIRRAHCTGSQEE